MKKLVFLITLLFSVGVMALTLDLSGVDSPNKNNQNWQVVKNILSTLIDGEVPVVSTAAEINRATDVSTRIVTLTADTTLTLADHEGKIILLGEVGGDATLDATLPAATGSGAVYKFIVSVANASGYEVQVTTTDIFDGYMTIVDGNLQTTINAVYDYTASDSDTLNMDSDAECGDKGDWVEVTDILSGVWSVKGVCRSNGASYTTVWAAEIGA